MATVRVGRVRVARARLAQKGEGDKGEGGEGEGARVRASGLEWPLGARNPRNTTGDKRERTGHGCRGTDLSHRCCAFGVSSVRCSLSLSSSCHSDQLALLELLVDSPSLLQLRRAGQHEARAASSVSN